MNVTEELQRFTAQSKGDVFLRSDFAQFGTPSQITRALRRMQAAGELVRIGLGVYARAKPSVLSGKPISARPLEELAPTTLQRLGIAVKPSKAVEAHNAGRTSQLPCGIVINTGNKRVARKLRFGSMEVRYEND